MGVIALNFYDYQRPVGKIEDIPELREKFIAIYDTKSKEETVRFGLAYGRHLIDILAIEPSKEINQVFEAMQRWLDGEASYHESRNIAFNDLYKYAKEENDIIKERFYRTMAQIACIPHVKFHALWATDFAITLINRMFPNNLDEVKKERKIQISLLENT